MASSCVSSGYDGATAGVGIRVLDALGGVLANGPTGNVFLPPWRLALNGTYPLLSVTDSAQLCDPPSSDAANSWADHVVLMGNFYFGGCSYETRARVAQQRGAAGLLFQADLHNSFEWDGSDHTGLPPSAFVYSKVYDCLFSNATGSASVDILGVDASPLEGGWYLTLNIILAVIILPLILSNVVLGLWQLHRFHIFSMDSSTKAVVGLEMVSQAIFFAKILNGTGYDHGWPILLPHWASRLTISVYQDIHMIALLLVSKQLRRTVEQINKFRTVSADELGSHNPCRAFCNEHGNTLLDVVVGIFILIELAIAILDANFGAPEGTVDLVLVLQMLFLGSMAYYFSRQTSVITNKLRETSSVVGANARVNQFATNIKRVGVALFVYFSLLVLSNALFLAEVFSGLSKYAVITSLFSIGALMASLQSTFMILSYKPSEAQRNSRASTHGTFAQRFTNHPAKLQKNPSSYLSRMDSGAIGSTKNISVTIPDETSAVAPGMRPSPANSEATPNSARTPGTSVRFDADSIREGASDRMSRDETSRNDSMGSMGGKGGKGGGTSPSPLKRAGSSFKTASKKIGGSQFNLFDEPGVASAITVAAAANTAANAAAMNEVSAATARPSVAATDEASAPASPTAAASPAAVQMVDVTIKS